MVYDFVALTMYSTPVVFSIANGPFVDHLKGGSRLNEDAEKPGANEEKREDQPENDPLPCARSSQVDLLFFLA